MNLYPSALCALWLSLKLALFTVLSLLPAALLLGRWLAWTKSPLRAWIEAGVLLPLVLPPTVMGFYLLQALGRPSWLGGLYESLTGQTLVFGFEGILCASILFNLPFAVQPVQRAFATIPPELREAAACCGLTPARSFWLLEWPLAWPGILAAMLLTFAHTLGEFGVVLMVGGNIPGKTQTLALVIYDRVQAMEMTEAHLLSLGLVGISFLSLAGLYLLSGPRQSGPFRA
ncbi:MAG: molybdate ABC transporter permease subunit [Candidatus Sericytochromatia bacterium]